MATLERALQIAVAAHAGQTDKSGEAYIFHPIRVMSRCTTPHGKIAALLHDVVEDTSVTLDELRAEGFPAEVITVLTYLSKSPGDRYEDYIDRIATDPVATEVKLADLEDNSDIRRALPNDGKSLARLAKYRDAYRKLTAASAGR